MHDNDAMFAFRIVESDFAVPEPVPQSSVPQTPATQTDINRLFPQPLVACIRDGRRPDADEFEIIRRRVLADAFGPGRSTPGGPDVAARVAVLGSLAAHLCHQAPS